MKEFSGRAEDIIGNDEKALARQSRHAVAVIVVNWNAWRLSLACLEGLRTSVGAKWHLYLVDNASTDDSRSRLQNLGADVTAIFSDINGGWTGGNNLAIRRALDDGYENIFILNNDAVVLSGTIAELLRFQDARADNPIVGPIHYDAEGLLLDFIGATTNRFTGMPEIRPARGTDPAKLASDSPTSFIKGAGILAKRVHFERLGLFDSRYYLNYDDTDWCFRAREAGFELIMLATTHILHAGSGSIGGVLSPLNIYFLARNELLFAKLHCSALQRMLHFVGFIRFSSRISPQSSRFRRLIDLLAGNGPIVRAWRMGVRDYLHSRFGDCPAEIRVMAGKQ